MTYSKALGLEFCTLSEAAYDLARNGTVALPAGYSAAVPILMDPAARPMMLIADGAQIWGYVTVRAGSVFVVFRGTLDGPEWLADAVALPMAPVAGFRVHRGFAEIYRALRAEIAGAIGRVPPGSKTFIGHSLGAAIATLAWLDMGGDLFTFNGPRVGDPVVGKTLWTGNAVRIVNSGDLVSNLPPDPPFEHGGHEIVLHGPATDRRVAHALESDRAGIGLQVCG
jgi:hypothetical protein